MKEHINVKVGEETRRCFEQAKQETGMTFTAIIQQAFDEWNEKRKRKEAMLAELETEME